MASKANRGSKRGGKGKNEGDLNAQAAAEFLANQDSGADEQSEPTPTTATANINPAKEGPMTQSNTGPQNPKQSSTDRVGEAIAAFVNDERGSAEALAKAILAQAKDEVRDANMEVDRLQAIIDDAKGKGEELDRDLVSAVKEARNNAFYGSSKVRQVEEAR
ncbi:MAG: hypothetical protein ABIH21_02430, partial [Patescibacteria group bacterium]